MLVYLNIDFYVDFFILKLIWCLIPETVSYSPCKLIDEKYHFSFTDSCSLFYGSWSFGIVLWELYSLGGSPYPGLPAEKLYSFLDEGNRMERPDRCPRDVYEIMLNCWKRSPFDRPSFKDIIKSLTLIFVENVEQVSLIYRLIGL